MSQELTKTEQEILLKIAREAIERSVRGQKLPTLALENLPSQIQAPGASFVTLTNNGRLRGCIGILEARQPLAIDVQEHAVAAALQDYRFPRVIPEELAHIQIEISILSPKQGLPYEKPEVLAKKIRPKVDGVVLEDGYRKATFLPQVWEQLEEPETFLSHLCAKMGGPSDLWRKKILRVYTYQVQEFHE